MVLVLIDGYIIMLQKLADMTGARGASVSDMQLIAPWN